MKKTSIIFLFLFAATLLIPLISVAQSKQQNTQKEIVTIFSSCVMPDYST